MQQKLSILGAEAVITDPIMITHAEAAAGACCARQASKCLRPARRGRLWLAGNHASARLSHKCQSPFQALALCELTAWQLMIALLLTSLHEQLNWQ